MKLLQPEQGNTKFYHQKKSEKRDRSTKQEDRKFIAWDGEGINLRGDGKPQSYVLFGSSEGHIENKNGLSTRECLEHIIATGQAHPRAVHIGFAFGYDSNMIVQSLSPVTLSRLHKHGWTHVKIGDAKYSLTYAKGKFFRVTKYHDGYHHKKNSTAKTTVQIEDVFSFFMSSFIKAYKDLIGPLPDIIITGKAGRKTFSLDEWDDILHYWSVEIQLLKELGLKLRSLVYEAGLRIRQWYGPGALASYAMTSRSIKAHMKESNSEIRRAARFAYAGGRFELFKLGRVAGPVYGVDINSAYPHAIAQLPSLMEGSWRYVERPERIRKFGVYHCRIKRFGGFVATPGPLFHRDKEHNITFPWVTDGWYWSPEASVARRAGAEIIDGWEYVDYHTYPFSWIPETYEQRREWKRLGISAQIALKLMMNSIYGKLAQRIGWNAETRRLPPFHQLEWAGWVTSYVRARLFNVMVGIPFEKLVAVETDGIYTTERVDTLGIHHSSDLGGWEVTEYAEMLYIQSGLAWLRHPDGCTCGKCVDGWESKRRGLDGCGANHRPMDCDCTGTFSLSACQRYLDTLHAQPTRSTPWPIYTGETTRFIGLGQALARTSTRPNTHCVWSTDKREILPGLSGKRIHVPQACNACTIGANAYDQAHDLVINSIAILDPRSYPHSIPWEPDEGFPRWRQHVDDDITLQFL